MRADPEGAVPCRRNLFHSVSTGGVSHEEVDRSFFRSRGLAACGEKAADEAANAEAAANDTMEAVSNDAMGAVSEAANATTNAADAAVNAADAAKDAAGAAAEAAKGAAGAAADAAKEAAK